MKILQQLIQEETGWIRDKKEWDYLEEKTRRVGKLKTLVVQNPCLDISKVIDEMAEKDSTFIPNSANAYVASDFNGDTQHIKDKKMYSVYAIQFYRRE